MRIIKTKIKKRNLFKGFCIYEDKVKKMYATNFKIIKPIGNIEQLKNEQFNYPFDGHYSAVFLIEKKTLNDYRVTYLYIEEKLMIELNRDEFTINLYDPVVYQKLDNEFNLIRDSDNNVIYDWDKWQSDLEFLILKTIEQEPDKYKSIPAYTDDWSQKGLWFDGFEDYIEWVDICSEIPNKKAVFVFEPRDFKAMHLDRFYVKFDRYKSNAINNNERVNVYDNEYVRKVQEWDWDVNKKNNKEYHKNLLIKDLYYHAILNRTDGRFAPNIHFHHTKILFRKLRSMSQSDELLWFRMENTRNGLMLYYSIEDGNRDRSLFGIKVPKKYQGKDLSLIERNEVYNILKKEFWLK